MKLPNWALSELRLRVLRYVLKHPKPHIVLGGEENPYLLRWYVIPRNRWLNVYLHYVCRSDDDRAMHDHPWPSMSLFVNGAMGEFYRTPRGIGSRSFKPGQIVFRSARFAHRLVVPDDARAVTLFITGPKVREWGFWCPQGFRHWRDFVAPDDSGKIGKGCSD